MGGGAGIDVSKALRSALVGVDIDAPTQDEMRVIVLAGFLDLLSWDYGLSEHHEEALATRATQPSRFLPFISHYLGVDFDALDPEALRTRLYEIVNDLAPENPVLAERRFGIAQVYWNLSWEQADRPNMPLRNGPLVDAPDRYGNSTKLVALIWAGWADYDQKDLGRLLRTRRTDIVKDGPIGTAGQELRASGARLSALMAKHLIATNTRTPPSLSAVTATMQRRGKPTISIVWKDDSASPDAPAGLHRHGSIEDAVAQVATKFEGLRGLAAITGRAGTFSPTTFLSGGSMTAAEVARYAVPRRIDFDGTIMNIEEVADRLCLEETVGFLPAGPGEGKSTYLHALSTAIADRAIAFTWNAAAELDWAELQRFRDAVASHAADAADPLPIVIVGELQRNPSREQEEQLIDTFLSVPSGLAPSRTSIVLAGRPAWLNRIRQRTPTGLTLRLMPLAPDEAESLVENLAHAYAACSEAKGEDWTRLQYPNLGQFLAMPPAARIAVFRQGSSLVGPLLRAAYGSRFTDRLRAEYADLAEPDREAYLLVSLATSSLGGISNDLLVSVCPEADVEKCSTGSPWILDHASGLHRARHEMIGRLVVEDADAATGREIGSTIRSVIDAARSDVEARDLLRNVVRIYDEPHSLIPDRQRKTEPQFRAAIRAGIMTDRTSWERFEESIGNLGGDLLSFSYFLHRLLPDKRGSGADYLLARSEHLLARAESAATPGSPVAERSRYHRILTAREARRLRGQVVDDPNDVKTLIPMMSHTWPEAILYAQVLSLGLSALKHCDLDDDEEDQIAQAILEAWQRLRVEGSTGEQVYGYAPFVSRELCDWPLERRLSLWQAAWEFSRALANPDGELACLIDVELTKLQKKSPERERETLARRRMEVLSLSVVPSQTDAEVVLRYAELADPDNASARHAVLSVASELAVSDDPKTRSMALHARAIVTSDAEERCASLLAAMADYEASMISRDEWLDRGPYWKRALRELRVLDREAATMWDSRVGAAGRKFAI